MVNHYFASTLYPLMSDRFESVTLRECHGDEHGLILLLSSAWQTTIRRKTMFALTRNTLVQEIILIVRRCVSLVA